MRRLVSGDVVADILEPYAAVVREPVGARPWVLANMVVGLDGSAAFAGRVGPLSEGADAELFRLMRAVADVVLVGASTFRAEGYGPVRLPEGLQQARTEIGRAPRPALAVVSRSLALDWTSSAFDGETLVVTTEDADPDGLAAASAVAGVVQAGSGGVDLAAALLRLGEEGHRVVLCEGGPTLLGELVDADLLDELCLTVAPIMGGDQLPVAITGVDSDVRRFGLVHAAVDSSSLFLRYERDRTNGR